MTACSSYSNKELNKLEPYLKWYNGYLTTQRRNYKTHRGKADAFEVWKTWPFNVLSIST